MTKTIRLLLISSFANAILWIALIPVWQYPDEQAHFSQVQNLAEFTKISQPGLNTSLEIEKTEQIFGTNRDGLGNNKFTYHPEFKINYSQSKNGLFENYIKSFPRSFRQIYVKNEATQNPPLYYLLASLPYKILIKSSLIGRVYAVRMMSLALFILTVLVSYNIAENIFEEKRLSLALASLIAFKPMLVYASTGILPDPLTNLLFATLLMFSLEILRLGLNLKNLIFSLAIISLGFLTRQQFLIAIPILAFPILFQILKKPKLAVKTSFAILSLFIIILGLSFASPSLSFLRSLKVPELSAINLFDIFTSQFVNYSRITFSEMFHKILPWYWGVYKWLSYTFPHPVYQIINRILVLATIGLAIKIYKTFRSGQIKSILHFLFLLYASVLYFTVIFIWDFYFQETHGYSFGLQGRYYFPMVIPHMILIITGLYEIYLVFFKKWKEYFSVVISVSIIMFNDFALYSLSSVYYDTSSLAKFINQASQYKPIIFKGPGIVLIIATVLGLQISLILLLVKQSRLSSRFKTIF